MAMHQSLGSARVHGQGRAIATAHEHQAICPCTTRRRFASQALRKGSHAVHVVVPKTAQKLLSAKVPNSDVRVAACHNKSSERLHPADARRRAGSACKRLEVADNSRLMMPAPPALANLYRTIIRCTAQNKRMWINISRALPSSRVDQGHLSDSWPW